MIPSSMNVKSALGKGAAAGFFFGAAAGSYLGFNLGEYINDQAAVSSASQIARAAVDGLCVLVSGTGMGFLGILGGITAQSKMQELSYRNSQKNTNNYH